MEENLTSGQLFSFSHLNKHIHIAACHDTLLPHPTAIEFDRQFELQPTKIIPCDFILYLLLSFTQQNRVLWIR